MIVQFFSEDDEAAPWAEVDLPDRAYLAIVAIARREGITFRQLTENLMREYLRSREHNIPRSA
jgi:hypothetical protein